MAKHTRTFIADLCQRRFPSASHCLAIFTVLLLCDNALHSQPRYSIKNLGTPTPDGWFYGPSRLNDLGQVVGGWVIRSEETDIRPFIWLPESAYGLPAGYNFITGPVVGDWATAFDINNNGMVVGTTYGGQENEGFFWHNGNLLSIDQDPDNWPRTGSNGRAINGAGIVVGSRNTGQYVEDVGYVWQAYKGTPGNLTNLGGFSENGVSYAWDINDLGQVVGQAASSAWGHAVMWDMGGIIDLGTLGVVDDNSYATKINDSSKVVGWSQKNGAGQSAFLWEDGVMKELWSDGSASSLNNRGEVVGSRLSRAVHWVVNTLTDLNDAIDSASGWMLRSALDINNRGQIVIEGIHEGSYRICLLTPIDGQCPVYDPDQAESYQTMFRSSKPAGDPLCELNWSNPTGGAFEQTQNWQGEADPTQDECDVSFNTGAASDYVVTFGGDRKTLALKVGRDLIRFALGGHSLLADAGRERPSLEVGNVAGQSGSLMVTGGTLQAGEGISAVGLNDGNGTLVISSGGRVEIPVEHGCVATLKVGSGGSSRGVVVVEEGGSLYTSWITDAAEEVGNVGEIAIQGSGSKWVGAAANIGNGGTGSATIRDGGEAELSFLSLGLQSNSSGEVHVTKQGSKLTFPDEGRLNVGISGDGHVLVDSGAQVTQPIGQHLSIGVKSGSYGLATVRTSGSRWTNEGLTQVGIGGEAVFSVEGGGNAFLANLEVGIGGEAAGLVRVTGQGSILALQFEDTDNIIGKSGGGKLSVSDGGVVLVSANLILGGDPGEGVPGVGTLEVGESGSRVEVSGALALGNRSQGRTSITGGAALQSQEVWIGFLNGPTNLASTMEITGAGSVVSTTRAIVGGGTGELTVSSSGRLSTDEMVISMEDDSRGDVLVDGPGSEIHASRISVAPRGVGSLRVRNGGFVKTGLLTVFSGGGTGSEGGTIEADQIDVGSPPALKRFTGSNQISGISTDTLIVGEDAILEVGRLNVLSTGFLHGHMAIPNDLTNAGILSPGDSGRVIGRLSVRGNYRQTSTGKVLFEFGGTQSRQHDMLAVDGTATLGGIVKFSLVDHFTPAVGDSFRVIQSGAIEGTFDAIEVPEGMEVELMYGPTGVDAVVTRATTVIQDGVQLPKAYTLMQNFPNPFNPSTHIRYALPYESHVRLTIYNVLGMEVITLVSQDVMAGYHSVQWDGRTASGGYMSSGAYYYRLEARSVSGGFNQISTKTMFLIR